MDGVNSPIRVATTIARDHNDKLIEGSSKIIVRSTVEETEAWGFLIGLQLATKLSVIAYIIKGDCQIVTTFAGKGG